MGSMGRYLSSGIAFTIIVQDRYNTGYVKEHIQEIEEGLKKSFDLSFYDREEKEDSFSYNFKLKEFDSYIHEFILEHGKDMPFAANEKLEEARRASLKMGKDFNQENYPLALKKLDLRFDWAPFTNFSSVFLIDYCENWRNIKLTPIIAQIGFDIDKVDFEDESLTLRLLNQFVRHTYHSTLSRNIVFYISG